MTDTLPDPAVVAAPSDAPIPPAVPRRVVVLAEKSWAGFYLTATLRRRGVNVTGLVVETEPGDQAFLNPAGWNRARKQIGLTRSTWAFFGLPLGPLYPARRARSPLDYPLLRDVRRLNVPVHAVPGFKTPECHAVLAGLRPDVTVICGTPILPESLLAVARTCTINIHTSILPHYRGGGSLFWPLFFGDHEKVGFTIHRAVAALDAGPYLAQQRVPVGPGDTPDRLLRKCFTAAAPRLADLLLRDPLTGSSWKEYAHPIRYVHRSPHPAVARAHTGPTPGQRVKAVARRVAVRLPYPRRRQAPRCAAFFFHRAIDDRVPAGDWRRVLGHPTVSELRAKLRFLQRHYQIVPLSRWLAELGGGRLDDNYAVVSVDDGYRDFRTHLAPLLDELNVPATLFVCTGAVETGTVWFQQVYDLIDRVPGDRLVVPWMDTAVRFGDTRHRVLVAEYVLLPYLKRLPADRRRDAVRGLLAAANRLTATDSPADAFCTPEEIRALARNPLVELHPHSHDHDPFETLTADELRSDLDRCRATFRDQFGLTSNVICYPNGRVGDGQREVLAEKGFAYGLTINNGVERPGPLDPLAIRRIGFGAEPLAEFKHRLRRVGALG